MPFSDPIIVVDDSAVIRQTVKGTLENMGCSSIDVAANGVEALNKCKAKSFKVIFLDWNMPEMDGLTFLKAYRGDLGIKNTAIIMLTAMSDKKDILLALENGATDYVTKPVSIDTIQKKMNQAMDWLAKQEKKS